MRLKLIDKSFYIPKGAFYWLENDAKNELVVIEVQTGDYFVKMI